ncbi:hypothetical protein LCGC14_1477080 [marine sediment metagenome]|uniref:Uncharacterized protein n=1 Tax=marine sediment metagenome TaxID=412755 RepID=A0A0F9LR51_9ZZZZ
MNEEIKTGDYVETKWACAGVGVGEHGFVIDGKCQGSIETIFPARVDYFASNGWFSLAEDLKLVRRFRPYKPQ